MEQIKNADKDIRLYKVDSNLFRNRRSLKRKQRRLNVSGLHNVLQIDTENNKAIVEGMAPFDTVVHETLKKGFMPCVVPELKSITVGGAISGVGIESSSFRYGFVHEAVEEMEILLSGGKTVKCSKSNKYKDLFFGIPNSYGTLGYILNATISLVPVKPFVKLTHIRYDNIESYFNDMERYSNEKYSFIDGVVFSEKEMYITLGTFMEWAPYTNHYTYLKIYYKSIQKRETDYLSIQDYIWRWDTDWFWCSEIFGLQNPLIRFIFGRWALNSRFYLKLGRINKRLKFLSSIKKIFSINTESIIQDVEIPVENAKKYLDFHLQNIPVRPIWICPMKSSSYRFDLYRTKPNSLYINFGFWKVIRSEQNPGYYNRLIENEVDNLNGKKSLYSDSYYTREKFWELYNWKAFQNLKQKYDPNMKFKNLYDKCVLKQ